MANGQTDLDKAISDDEPAVLKISPNNGKSDEAASKAAEGGSSKLSTTLKPFTLKGV